MSNAHDPLDFIKNMWGNLGFTLPGMVTPTLDTDELEKRIADLKAVEGWLKTNLNMLQMTIQGLEMQRATLMAMQALSQSASGTEPSAPANPFASAALWQWPFMPQEAAKPAEPAQEPEKAPEAAGKAPAKGRKKAG